MPAAGRDGELAQRPRALEGHERVAARAGQRGVDGEPVADPVARLVGRDPRVAAAPRARPEQLLRRDRDRVDVERGLAVHVGRGEDEVRSRHRAAEAGPGATGCVEGEALLLDGGPVDQPQPHGLPGRRAAVGGVVAAQLEAGRLAEVDLAPLGHDLERDPRGRGGQPGRGGRGAAGRHHAVGRGQRVGGGGDGQPGQAALVGAQAQVGDRGRAPAGLVLARVGRQHVRRAHHPHPHLAPGGRRAVGPLGADRDRDRRVRRAGRAAAGAHGEHDVAHPVDVDRRPAAGAAGRGEHGRVAGRGAGREREVRLEGAGPVEPGVTLRQRPAAGDDRQPGGAGGRPVGRADPLAGEADDVDPLAGAHVGPLGAHADQHGGDRRLRQQRDEGPARAPLGQREARPARAAPAGDAVGVGLAVLESAAHQVADPHPRQRLAAAQVGPVEHDAARRLLAQQADPAQVEPGLLDRVAAPRLHHEEALAVLQRHLDVVRACSAARRGA